jgi:hypothetical protein
MKLIVHSADASRYHWTLVDPLDTLVDAGVSSSVALALKEAGEELPLVALQFWWDGHCLGTVPSTMLLEGSDTLAEQFSNARRALIGAGLAGA